MNSTEFLQNKHFNFQDCDCIIKKRVKGLQEKPPLYIWNLSKSCYVSSLKPLNDEQTKFQFDVKRDRTVLDVWILELSEKGKITVEKVG